MISRDELGERATGVVADEGDLFELEALEQLPDQAGEPRRREIGGGVHRRLMRP